MNEKRNYRRYRKKRNIKILVTHNNIPVTKIAHGAFSGSIDLKHIVIPDIIISIGDMAFEHCCRLISVILPDKTQNIFF